MTLDELYKLFDENYDNIRIFYETFFTKIKNDINTNFWEYSYFNT